MVQIFPVLLAGLAVVSVQAGPLQRRIAQVISASTQKWEQACLAAGGGQQCNPVSVTAFTTLLAAAGPCDQQNSADAMVDLGKQLGSANVISLAQIFAQQPRNTPTSQAVPYCQQAPKNSELNGLFQCQFVGANQQTFVGGAKVGAAGTIPFGLNAPLNPLGSCPAHPQGPIADGTQLVDQVQVPNAPNPPASQTPAPAATASAPPAQTTVATGGGRSGGNSGFALANGQAAQALNKEFQGLTANSSCQAGENACVNGNFAQCVGDKFVVTVCAGGLTCAALPLVNSVGTSVTCTTQADALARIQATGATGGIFG